VVLEGSVFKSLQEERKRLNSKTCLSSSTNIMHFVVELTGSFRALRRKKALQLSHAIAPKLYPFADDPQTTQIKGSWLVLFFLGDGCILVCRHNRLFVCMRKVYCLPVD
jgi:hypothetical protein